MDALMQKWLAEEAIAHIHGWDFSHISGKYTEEDDLPWDYREEILRRLSPDMQLLDQDTGGGEFLLSLGHPHKNTSATENYPPNAALCRQTLEPLGITFRECSAGGAQPFDDASFDMVINRHGDFCAAETARILKKGGLFITQQVGAINDREFVDLLLPGSPIPFPDQHLDIAVRKFRECGFEITDAREAFRPIRFFDSGALVWFARIIEWEFPGFSVERCEAQLREADRLITENGFIEAQIHRFFLAAKKI